MNAREPGIDLGSFDVLGVPIRAVDYVAAVRNVVQAAQRGQPYSVSALAVHGVMTGALDPQHRFRLNKCDMLVPDGQPVRWALRWLHGIRLHDRVYGPRMMLEICKSAAEFDLPIYLYGSTKLTLQKLSENLQSRFPKLRIVGTEPSKFRRLTIEEKSAIVSSIQESGASIVFTGIGCPRQEVWAYEYRDALQTPIVAVGAAYNFHAGDLAQAPQLLQNLGLEWAFRLAHEPLRLWRRYLILNPLFLTFLAAQRFGVMDFCSSSPPSEELRDG